VHATRSAGLSSRSPQSLPPSQGQWRQRVPRCVVVRWRCWEGARRAAARGAVNLNEGFHSHGARCTRLVAGWWRPGGVATVTAVQAAQHQHRRSLQGWHPRTPAGGSAATIMLPLGAGSVHTAGFCGCAQQGATPAPSRARQRAYVRVGLSASVPAAALSGCRLPACMPGGDDAAQCCPTLSGGWRTIASAPAGLQPRV